MKHLGALLVVLAPLVCTGPALGCTKAVHLIERFNPSEYVLVGEVVGYQGPFPTGRKGVEGWALLVQPRAVVNLPRAPRRYVEIVEYRTYSDCSTEPVNLTGLEDRFPVGTLIDVIGEEAHEYTVAVSEGDIRLEIELDLLDTTTDRNFAAVSEYQCHYKNFSHPESGRMMERGCSHSTAFELRKDLLRLKNAESRRDRIQVLKRLVFYPSVWDQFYFDGTVERVIGNGTLAHRLKKQRRLYEAYLFPQR